MQYVLKGKVRSIQLGACRQLLSLIILLVIAASSLNSCTDKDNDSCALWMDIDDTPQNTIKYLLSSRAQVLDTKYEDIVFSIFLQDTCFTIDTRVIPLIEYMETGKGMGLWLVNGKAATESELIRIESKQCFPNLSISSDGRLTINGYLSNYSLNKSLVDVVINKQECVWAVARNGFYLSFYRANGSNVTIPIVDTPEHLVPDYFIDSLISKEVKADNLIKDLPADDFTRFVFFTDAHWYGGNQKHSPAIIKHIVDYTSIKRVLFGGDVITYNTVSSKGALDEGKQFHDAFSFLGGSFYCLFGNHDDNTLGQVDKPERHLSEEQVYSYLQSQMTNVSYWDYYNFYYDDPVSKTRFLCFDTGRWYESQLRGSIFKTAQFAIESLSAVPQGWHIVAASHLWTDLVDAKTAETQESEYVRPIIEILENYNLRKKSSFSFGKTSINYDFSTANSIIEYCLGGHTHTDAIIHSKMGLPIITVTCDGQVQVPGNISFQTGTINEQCVTIVVNDYQGRKVHVCHIGRGEDADVDMWR